MQACGDALAFAPQVKGLEMPGYEPRGLQTMALGLAVGTRVAYLWCAEGILAGRLAEAVNRALGDGVTTRNWATIMKLHGLAG